MQVNVVMWALDLPTIDRPTTLCIQQFDRPTVSGLIVPPTPAITQTVVRRTRVSTEAHPSVFFEELLEEMLRVEDEVDDDLMNQ